MQPQHSKNKKQISDPVIIRDSMGEMSPKKLETWLKYGRPHGDLVQKN